MCGIDEVKKGRDTDLMEHLVRYLEVAEDGSLTFANFVEFDSHYGHRRDVSGYARARPRQPEGKSGAATTRVGSALVLSG